MMLTFIRVMASLWTRQALSCHGQKCYLLHLLSYDGQDASIVQLLCYSSELHLQFSDIPSPQQK